MSNSYATITLHYDEYKMKPWASLHQQFSAFIKIVNNNFYQEKFLLFSVDGTEPNREALI